MHSIIKKEKLQKYLKIIKEIVKLRKDTAVLRSIYYSFKFRGGIFIGKKSTLKLDKNAKIIIKNNATLRIGMDYKFPNGASVYLSENAKVIIKGNSRIMKGCFLELLPGAVLELGKNSYFNEQSRIRVAKRLYVGDNAIVAFRAHIMDSDAHKITEFGEDINKLTADDITKDIIIEDHVWIGANALILKGVKISTGSVIAAGSVVTKDIPKNVLAGGNPCKIIKENIQWKF